MAGTLHYRLQVDHVYQRRFGQDELAEALKTSHWYIVTRRPCVRIVEDSAVLDDRILTVDVVTRTDLARPRSVHTLGQGFGQFQSLANFRTYEHGAYFSVEIDGKLAHGDAWSLASLLSSADVELAAQEVLYIGEAFGKDGSTNVWHRVRAHQKLQQIYEDHADLDCDIFVVPLSLERGSLINDDHIDDTDDGPSLEQYYQHFATRQGGIRKPSVDLIEHSLIAYFSPPYNELLAEWRYEAPTKSMRLMRGAGFRLIQVHLSGKWGLARFYSETVPDRLRSHLISHDLPPEPRRPVFRGITAERLSSWKMQATMVREGQELLEESAARTGVTIHIFGEKAPKIRRPPGVDLPALPPLVVNTGDAHDEIRADIAVQQESQRWMTEPIKHPGVSTYDPTTGSVTLGEYADGTAVRIGLHDPETGRVHSAIVFGESGSGRTNHLRVHVLEALMTGLFVPAIADVAAGGEWRMLRTAAEEEDLFAEGLDESINLLRTVGRIIDARVAARNYREPSSEMPAILVGIDDSDELLKTDQGAALVHKIITDGGDVGVGVALVLGDIADSEDNLQLITALMSVNHKMAYTPRGDLILQYLEAKYKRPRQETWGNDETPLFVVHQDARNAVLGFAAAWVESHVSETWAKKWALDQLREEKRALAGEWEQVGEDSASWSNRDQMEKSWYLRRHNDVWLLVMAETVMPNVPGPDLIARAEAQIKARYEVQLGDWQRGPGTGAEGTEVFYVEGVGSIARKDMSEAIKRAIADMY